MELKDQLTSLELSKRLDGLGVNAGSHFVWHSKIDEDGNSVHTELVFMPDNELLKQDYRAYSVAELGEMLPKQLQIDEYLCNLEIVRSSVWRFYYGKSLPNAVCFTAMTDNTEANARGEMLCYLLENGLLDVDTV